MKLSEQIEINEKKQKELVKDLKTAPFTQEEKDYWSDYILNHIKDGICNLEDDLYSDTLLYKGGKINRYRLESFKEWIKDEGLYYHGQFNSQMEIMTLNAVLQWEESIKKNKQCMGKLVYGEGVVKYKY